MNYPVYRKTPIGSIETGNGDTPFEVAALHTITEYVDRETRDPKARSKARRMREVASAHAENASEVPAAGITDFFEVVGPDGIRVQVALGDACRDD